MSDQQRLRYLLDTNICIYIINRRPAGVFRHFEGLNVGEVGISSITGAELKFGAAKSRSTRNQQALDKFLAPLDVVAFDEAAMCQYGILRADLEQRGTPIGSLDTLIAAQALSLAGITLVTNNEQEFSRVSGLRIENWVAR